MSGEFIEYIFSYTIEAVYSRLYQFCIHKLIIIDGNLINNQAVRHHVKPAIQAENDCDLT